MTRLQLMGTVFSPFCRLVLMRTLGKTPHRSPCLLLRGHQDQMNPMKKIVIMPQTAPGMIWIDV